MLRTVLALCKREVFMNDTKSTELIVDEALRERLAKVQVRYQLSSIEQALEFLVRRSIRRSGEQLIGRRRTLRIVKG